MTKPSESSKSWIRWSIEDQEISESSYAQAFWQKQSQSLERLLESYPPGQRDLTLRLSRSGHPLCWQLEAELALPIGQFSSSARDDTLLTTVEQAAHALTTKVRQHFSQPFRGGERSVPIRRDVWEDSAHPSASVVPSATR